MENHEMLSQVDREVLVALLVGGDNTPKNLSEITGRHDQACQSRLAHLEDEDLVENKGGGVYRLTQQGLESARVIYQDYNVADGLDFD